jgi:energy-coupling factor transport system ATP-binding protein
MSLISVTDLKYIYPGAKIPAVDGVSFQIEEGDYCAVVGANGSGKSTIARLIAGLFSPSEGSINFSTKVTVGMVFQSPKDQIISGIVSRDTSFGPQNLRLPKSEIELRTIECLNIVDLLQKASSSSYSLSLGQTQKLAISGILAIWPKVMILDESVAMLDPASRKSIFEFLRYWNRHGNTVIHITHDIDAVKETKKVIALEKGKVFYNGKTSDFLKNEKYLLNLTGPALTVIDKKKAASKLLKKETSFGFNNVFYCYGNDEKSAVKNINFKLKKGSLTALTGPSGAGKSTILELASGLLKPDSGEIMAASFPSLALQNSADAVFETFAADDVAFGLINRGVKGEELKLRVKIAMDSVNLPFEEYMNKPVSTMSGGELRRLALAGIIVLDKDVMLFDEPTAGLDGKSKYEVMKLLRRLADSGKTVLYSTHNHSEAAFADREISVKDGAIVKDTLYEYDFVPEKENKTLDVLSTRSGIGMLEKIRNSVVSLSGIKRKKKYPVEYLHPSLRFVLFMAIFVCVLAFKNFISIGIMLGVSVLYSLLCGFSLKKYLHNCIKVLPYLLIITVFQLIFHPAVAGEVHYVELSWLLITPSKLLFCLATLLRTFAALGCISAFFVSTPEYDFIEGIRVLLKPLEVIKIPVRYLIVILEILFRFIPLLVDEAGAIVKTQVLRGALGKSKGKLSRVKAFIPLIIPLIVQTIKKAEALSDAIIIRCFR